MSWPKGHTPWNKGLPWNEAARHKMSESAKRRGVIPEAFSPKARAKRSASMSKAKKKQWQDPEFRERLLSHLNELNQSPQHRLSSARGARILQEKHPELIESFIEKGHRYIQTDEGRRKLSEAARAQWLRMKAEMIKAQRRGFSTPNEKERLLQAILDRRFSNEWEFVGNGEVVIGNLVPDFINCNGQKLIIELFGDYWHSPERTQRYSTEEERKAVFEKYGFRLLVIWEHELKSLPEEAIVEKIRRFANGSNIKTKS